MTENNIDEDLGRDLVRQYARRFDEQADYRNEVWKVLVDEYFQRFVNVHSAVLDLGCGYAQFINNITATSKFAIDLNPVSATLVGKNVTFFEQDCASSWPLAAESLDVVFTSNFLEHLPNKATIKRAMAEVHRCLRRGGSLICLGPNIRFTPGTYWDFWDHHVPLSDRSLSEMLELTGFDIKLKLAKFLPYTMAGGPTLPTIALKLYLKLPFAWELFGKQFLIVATRR